MEQPGRFLISVGMIQTNKPKASDKNCVETLEGQEQDCNENDETGPISPSGLGECLQMLSFHRHFLATLFIDTFR